MLHSGLKQYAVTQSLSTWTAVYRGGHSAADLVNVKLSSIADTLAQVLFKYKTLSIVLKRCISEVSLIHFLANNFETNATRRAGNKFGM